MTDSTPHGSHTPAAGPAVGQDEWVARHARAATAAAVGSAPVEERLRAVPWWAWLVLFLAAMSLLPVVEASGYVRRVGFDTVLYMLLALGLNVVVGWGGLLDLGYVAFYGIGAYTYAILDSPKFGIHLPTLVAIPVVVIVGAVVGFLLGLPSRRLTGDYLAIVTLFFLQLFQTLTTNGDSAFGHNITGGPNGILNVDPFHAFGHNLSSSTQGVFAVSYYYVALGVLRGRLRRASLRQPLAHGPRLAIAARGPARRRGDGHAGQLAEADELLVRRRGRGAHGHALRCAERERLPAHVLLHAADHRLHDGHPRRLRAAWPGVVLGALIIGPLLELLRDAGQGARRLLCRARRRPVLSRSAARACSRDRRGATLAFGFVVARDRGLARTARGSPASTRAASPARRRTG